MSSLSLDLYPLSENWIPNELLIRNKELQILNENSKDNFPQNLWIYGDKGLGKSLTTRIFSQMNQNVFVLNCTSQSFKDSVKRFCLSHNVIPRSDESPVTQLINVVANITPSELTICFDDVDKLGRYLKRDFGPYLHDLYDRLMEKNIKFSINVITTADYEDVNKFLSSPAQSRLKFKPLKFHRYTSPEIITLLKQRLQYIHGVTFQEEAITLIAERISRIGGDFRKALEITRNALKLNGKLTTEAVESAWSAEKVSFWKSQIADLSYHMALLLACIVEETAKIHNSRDIEPPYFPVSWDAIKNRYRKRTSQLNVDPQSEKMLYYWLEQLWLKKWIDKFTLSKRHEWNYTQTRGLYLRLLEKTSNLIPAINEIDWRTPW
jgi:Cdc6-like AAA superfamily ATPase